MLFGIVSFKHKMYMYRNHQQTLQFNKFDDFRELNQNVIWYSDLTKEDVWRLGCLNIYKIKHNKYLNTSFQQLENVLIGDINETNENNIKTFFLKMLFVFEKIMSLCLVNMDKEDVFDWKTEELYVAIRKNLFTNLEQYIPQVLSDVLAFSYQDVVEHLSEKEVFDLEQQGYKIVEIKKNGLSYANELMDKLKIPTKDYIQYSHKDIQHQIKLLKEEKKVDVSIQNFFLKYVNTPYLVQINKKTLKTEYDNYKTLLESNSIVFLNAKRIERKWITSVEFAYLSKFFNFEIGNAIIFDRYLDKREIIDTYHLENVFIKYDDISYFSIVITLLMENYTLALQEKNFETHKVNILNSFLSASDKKELLLVSLLLESNKYRVKSYGKNTIELMLTEEDLNNPKLTQILEKINYVIF